MKTLRWMLILLCFSAMPAFAQKARVHDYSTRLASLLADTQGKAMIGPASWKAIANEANALAGDARAHVREMHKAAMKGDADGARTHAGLALPFVYQLIDWSS